MTNLDAMLKRADMVTVHVPLADGTWASIGAESSLASCASRRCW